MQIARKLGVRVAEMIGILFSPRHGRGLPI
jgi:hypothetical protein